MYDRSQKGWILYSLFSVLLTFLFFVYINQWGNNPVPFWPFLYLIIILLFTFLLFYKLRIIIKSAHIEILYGIDLIRFTLKPDTIESIQVINAPWWYGLGIRITQKGKLDNIYGLKAIRMIYKEDGKAKHVMLGTSEPQHLKAFILDHFSKNV